MKGIKMEEELQRNMVAATKNVQKCESTGGGGARYEKEYGIAFYGLVRAGLASPIRKKYRAR